MKFLKKSKRWMKAHWQNKSFRIFLAVNILLVVLLSVENMLLFSAGVLKMLRYVILLCGVAVIACIDRRSKRIPNDPAGTGVYSGVGIDRGMCNVSVVCAVHDHIRTSRKYPGRRYVPDLLFYYKGRCRHG